MSRSKSRIFYKIKYRIRLIIPSSIWEDMSKIVAQKKEHEFKEIEVSYGTLNSESKIFIIRRRPPGAGLFSNVNLVMQGLVRAKEIGAIPIVDFENYWMDEYATTRPINGSKNSWDQFFKPVSNLTLDEAYSSKNVILSAGQRILGEGLFSSKSYQWIFNEEMFQLIAQNASNILKLNDSLENELNEYKKQHNIDEINILGVSVRGGNYEKYQYSKHAKQPSVNLIEKEIDYVINKYKVDKIYVQTHDYDKFEKIKNNYGDIILPNIALEKYQTYEQWKKQSPKDRPKHWDNSPKQNIFDNQNYAKEIFLLSSCSYFVGGISGGSAYAKVLNNGKYIYQHIFNIGED